MVFDNSLLLTFVMCGALAVGAACLACALAVGFSSYFQHLTQLHLLKQNDRLNRRVVSFSANKEARILVGFEAQAEASHRQTELLNALDKARPQGVEAPEEMAQ